jgi:hypothetical protein
VDGMGGRRPVVGVISGALCRREMQRIDAPGGNSRAGELLVAPQVSLVASIVGGWAPGGPFSGPLGGRVVSWCLAASPWCTGCAPPAVEPGPSLSVGRGRPGEDWNVNIDTRRSDPPCCHSASPISVV